MNIEPLITNAGDQAITINFGDTIDTQISSFVFEISESLRSFQLDGILDIIPSYCSIMIQYDPLVITSSYIHNICKELCSQIKSNYHSKTSRIISIPVLYEKEYALDIEFVSKHTGLSTEEIIKIHTTHIYTIFMIGFTPGFPYMGISPNKLTVPRKTTPSKRILAGSIGLAENQTGIYPIESAGGWQIIGNTPLNFFDISLSNPSLFNIGDQVKFEALNNIEEYDSIKKLSKNNKYKPTIKNV